VPEVFAASAGLDFGLWRWSLVKLTSVGLSVGFYGGRHCFDDASGCLGWWFLEEICVDEMLLW
jgi:hypothetical protein